MNRFFIFLFIVFFTVTGCNKEDSGIDTTDYASVSIYAVVPEAPEFNFFLNGTNIAASVPFGSYTLYDRVAAGNVTLHAQSSSREITIDTSFSVAASQYYSLFITGNIGNIQPVVLKDALPSLTLDSCGLRFFVFSQGVSGIDFHIVKSDTLASINKGWTNRNYSDNILSDSINTFKKFVAGSYSFYAVRSANNSDTIARFASREFSDSSNYTLMLEGHFASGDTSLMLGTRLHNSQ